jgi:hypothetical protein
MSGDFSGHFFYVVTSLTEQVFATPVTLNWRTWVRKRINISVTMEPDRISHRSVSRYSGPWKTIISAALLAGTLDALGAIIVYQANPARMFKFIASGAFGAGAAFSGGASMIVWGISFHYLITFFWTILFFVTYPAIPVLSKHRLVAAVAYGILVWIMMNKVVIPLSAITPGPSDLRSALVGTAILIVAVGLPLAILTHRYYSRTGRLRDNA